MNLQAHNIEIVQHNAWSNAGFLKVKFEYKEYEDNLIRQAGMINDNSFFELSLQASSDDGRFQLFPGAVFDPIDALQKVGNNKFQIDLADKDSGRFSDDGYAELQIPFLHSEDGLTNLNNVQYTIKDVQLCEGGYVQTVNRDVPDAPAGCSVVPPDQMRSESEGGQGNGNWYSSITGNPIGCESHVYVGFDDEVTFDELVWPISNATVVNKRLKPCEFGERGCTGLFYRLDFFNENLIF